MVKLRTELTADFVAHLHLMGVRGVSPGMHKFDSETSFETPVDLRHAYVWDTEVHVGAFTYLGADSHLTQASVGRYCSVAKGVQIGPSRHPIDWLTTSTVGFMHFPAFEEPLMDEDPSWRRQLPVAEGGAFVTTNVGNDVWIGNGACLKEGITIGDGAIIGAMAMVTRDVPPYAIVVGNPARVLRMRFPDPVIERMLAVRWWRYNLLDLAIDPTHPMRALDQIEALVADGLQPYAPPVMNLADEYRRFRKMQRRMLKQAA